MQSSAKKCDSEQKNAVFWESLSKYGGGFSTLKLLVHNDWTPYPADSATQKVFIAPPMPRFWQPDAGAGRILFHPAVANGRVYAATDDGTLVCLETQDLKTDGWSMWGVSGQHNAKQMLQFPSF
jgi:hypothetical protein